jgi:hypothetical protein
MNDRLIIATLAGVGFLAALGIAIERGDLWQPPAHTRLEPAAVPLRTMAIRPVTAAPAAVAATQPLPAAPEPAASAPAPDGRAGPDLNPAPSYEEEAAARDRAAAHSARSR